MSKGNASFSGLVLVKSVETPNSTKPKTLTVVLYSTTRASNTEVNMQCHGYFGQEVNQGDVLHVSALFFGSFQSETQKLQLLEYTNLGDASTIPMDDFAPILPTLYFSLLGTSSQYSIDSKSFTLTGTQYASEQKRTESFSFHVLLPNHLHKLDVPDSSSLFVNGYLDGHDVACLSLNLLSKTLTKPDASARSPEVLSRWRNAVKKDSNIDRTFAPKVTSELDEDNTPSTPKAKASKRKKSDD
jgi:hypothetical protein